jgi:hypothetical protein
MKQVRGPHILHELTDGFRIEQIRPAPLDVGARRSTPGAADGADAEPLCDEQGQGVVADEA